uniref:Putative c-type lectin n=1 Tax=Anopheles braziliensis TaxID=58242 RepID=A0A2M3ZE00_9DIPT
MEHSKRLFVVLFASYLCSVQLVQSQISAREMLLRDKCICPCGNPTGGKQYQVPNQRLNWFDAASYCNAIGMSLVTIKDAGEAQRLYESLPTTLRSTSYWIGANMLTTDYHLQWELTGEVTYYETWADGEPSTRKGYCVYIKSLLPGEKTWYSDNCLTERKFICQF